MHVSQIRHDFGIVQRGEHLIQSQGLLVRKTVWYGKAKPAYGSFELYVLILQPLLT